MNKAKCDRQASVEHDENDKRTNGPKYKIADRVVDEQVDIVYSK